MKQHARLIVLLTLAVVLVFGQVASVAAKPPKPSEEDSSKYPGCQASASALFGPAPLTVDFSAKSPDEGVAYNWGFGDGLGETGKEVTHTYTAEGVYRVRAFVTGADGFYNTCPLLIVTVGANSNPVDVATTTPTPEPVVTFTPVVVATSGSNAVAKGNTRGNNNVDPNIAVNDSNNVTINIGQPTAQPVVVQATAPTTQKVFWLFALPHAVFKGIEAFFHYLDEGFFPVVLAH